MIARSSIFIVRQQRIVRPEQAADRGCMINGGVEVGVIADLRRQRIFRLGLRHQAIPHCGFMRRALRQRFETGARRSAAPEPCWARAASSHSSTLTRRRGWHPRRQIRATAILRARPDRRFDPQWPRRRGKWLQGAARAPEDAEGKILDREMRSPADSPRASQLQTLGIVCVASNRSEFVTEALGRSVSQAPTNGSCSRPAAAAIPATRSVSA